MHVFFFQLSAIIPTQIYILLIMESHVARDIVVTWFFYVLKRGKSSPYLQLLENILRILMYT